MKLAVASDKVGRSDNFRERTSPDPMSNWGRYRRHSKSILDCIGNTPLVRLNRVTSDVKAEILVKLEYFSPSGSLKDRIYLNMIEKAETRGDLKPRSEEHTSELQ